MFAKGALFLFDVCTLLNSLLMPCDRRLYGFPLGKAIGSIARGKTNKKNEQSMPPVEHRVAVSLPKKAACLIVIVEECLGPLVAEMDKAF